MYLPHSENNPGKHHTIIYDHVVTNYGNGYNKYTGAFIAPRSGVYVFTWTTFANPGSYLPIELIVNNYRYGIISVDTNALYNGVTGVAVVHLNQYDAVLVRSDLEHENFVFRMVYFFLIKNRCLKEHCPLFLYSSSQFTHDRERLVFCFIFQRKLEVFSELFWLKVKWKDQACVVASQQFPLILNVSSGKYQFLTKISLWRYI